VTGGRRRRGSAGIWLLVLLVGGQLIRTVPATAAAPATVFAEGTITSISPDALVVATSSGSTQVKPTPQTRVSRRIAVTLDAITAGDYIGASSRREADGSLTARINFPPGTEITRYFVTTRADLRVGRRVLALGTAGADGSLIAISIQIAPGR